MKIEPALTAMALAFVLAGVAIPARADPLSVYDENMRALQIMGDCKVDFRELDRKYPNPEPKLKAMGDAAWRQLWAELDAQDSAHHDENAHKANSELNKRTEAVWAQARALLADKGCDALVPDARAVVEKSMQ